MNKRRLSLLPVLIMINMCVCLAQSFHSDFSYMPGREYFVMRSGQVKMVVQSDKTGTMPAFSFLLFDAEETAQTARKKYALNYSAEDKFYSSAIEVLMKNFPFTALAGNTKTEWINRMGIPYAKASWWASGIEVEEEIAPLVASNAFIRTVKLTSKSLMAIDTAYVRISMPVDSCLHDGSIMTCNTEKAVIGVKVVSDFCCRSLSNRQLTIGPILLERGESKSVKLIYSVDIKNTTEMSARLNEIEANENQLLSESVDWWNQLNTVSTKDHLIQDIYDAARYSLPGFIAKNGAMDAGVFEYGNQWVRDASNTSIGMTHIGQFELSRAILEHMLIHMIKDEGNTMISGAFDSPDREQFDQMGEFIHAMKSYVDWTGDSSLLTKYRKKILAMVERPLHMNFRDETKMVHNRREFWERTFDDAYELAYQTWMIVGLRDAADLAIYLGAEKRVPVWRKEADDILHSMIHHPSAKLIDNGHLIKRRNTNKEIVDMIAMDGWVAGAPASVEHVNGISPDATMALPIAMKVIDPKSQLAGNTLAELEQLWNQRWYSGGYERYNSSSEGDQPGPWSFATTFIMRAQHEAGCLDLSRRSLDWLYTVAGGRTGAYYEVIPILHASMYASGLLPWTSAEVTYFIVHHLLGLKFEGQTLTIKPNLYLTTTPVQAKLRYKDSYINVEIEGAGNVLHAIIKGKVIQPDTRGTVVFPADFKGGNVKIIMSGH